MLVIALFWLVYVLACLTLPAVLVLALLKYLGVI